MASYCDASRGVRERELDITPRKDSGPTARSAATIDGRRQIDRRALTAAYAFLRFAPPRDVFDRSKGAARFAAIP
jgi:hypothetical protein